VNIRSALAHLSARNVRLYVEGGELFVTEDSTVNDEQMSFIRAHREALLAELRTPAELRQRFDGVVAKLVDDCIAFYTDDYDDLRAMTEAELERCVLDFLSRRDFYLRQPRTERCDIPTERSDPSLSRPQRPSA